MIGRAIDVGVEPRVVSEDVMDGGRVRRVIEAVLLNAKAGPVRLEVTHDDGGETRHVTNTSHPMTVEGGLPTWTFRLAAGGRALLRYTVESGG